jgi:hypothetical protein
MSASSLSLPFLVPNKMVMGKRELPRENNERVAALKIVRRRPTMQQGRALETLGHAIEYLVDSRMFLVNESHVPAESDAVRLLSQSSRAVFSTCAEIVPFSQRLKNWAQQRLNMSSLGHFGPPSPRQA